MYCAWCRLPPANPQFGSGSWPLHPHRRSLVARQRHRIGEQIVDVELDPVDDDDALRGPCRAIPPRSLIVASEHLDGGQPRGNENVRAQRRQLLIALPFRAPIVLLGRQREDFDQDRGVEQDVLVFDDELATVRSGYTYRSRPSTTTRWSDVNPLHPEDASARGGLRSARSTASYDERCRPSLRTPQDWRDSRDPAYTKDGWGAPKSGKSRTVDLAWDVVEMLREAKPRRPAVPR